MRGNGYRLAELIDVARLQRLCDGLSAVSGTVLAVLDPDGEILVASGWQDICTVFHRANAASASDCLESDRRINQRLAEGIEAPEHIAYKCANGLWDVAFPLLIDGRHVATVFTGQFFYDDDEVDVEAFRAQATRAGLRRGGVPRSPGARPDPLARAGRADHRVPGRPRRHACRPRPQRSRPREGPRGAHGQRAAPPPREQGHQRRGVGPGRGQRRAALERGRRDRVRLEGHPRRPHAGDVVVRARPSRRPRPHHGRLRRGPRRPRSHELGGRLPVQEGRRHLCPGAGPRPRGARRQRPADTHDRRHARHHGAPAGGTGAAGVARPHAAHHPARPERHRGVRRRAAVHLRQRPASSTTTACATGT